MNAPQWQSQIVPARLAYLAIYNPSLGPSDETFADQLVFYHSRAAHEARANARKNARNDKAGGDAIRQEENEKLRNIGLAQGMVDFARTFSNGRPVDSVDTEKSRIVLQELEKGWWILASIDLTRLPNNPAGASSNAKKKKATDATETTRAIEYSAREVSPARLLNQQLLQAHYIFTAHHGPSLTELFVRQSRDKFCATLDRYWSRFCRTWDVLLHGNPASDVFSGIKLASGGELGIGVGEEEWGSGEREVLEDLTRRSEGLVDMLVSRFGDAPSSQEEELAERDEAVPWMGSGALPTAADGLVFAGVNAISRSSLRSVSLWMRQIYTCGDHAYGVRDNPLRERRKRRRRDATIPDSEENERVKSTERPPLIHKPSQTVSTKDWTPKDSLGSRTPSDRSVITRKARIQSSQSSSTQYPGIPPPIVTATEEALDRATRQAESTAAAEPESSTTLGIPDQYMKYLTLGLSTLAKSSSSNRPPNGERTSSSSSQTLATSTPASLDTTNDARVGAKLTTIEPIPEGEPLNAKIKAQRSQENKGHFLIGFRGDLDTLPDTNDGEESNASMDDDSGGDRILLRTLQVEVNHEPLKPDEPTPASEKCESEVLLATNTPSRYRKLRVLIYIRRPFMYCFLFENRTPSLTIISFYKDLHLNLIPVHKPLLVSTSHARALQRIEEVQAASSTNPESHNSVNIAGVTKTTENAAHIYDLIFDPALLTIHTSIPNIPEPGTPAAEGLLTIGKQSKTSPPWTRVDALNVHSSVLNTLDSVSHNPRERECTSKTNRGWWIVWMQLPPSTPPPPPTSSSPNPSAINSTQASQPQTPRRTSSHPIATLRQTLSDETNTTATTNATSNFAPLPSIASSSQSPPQIPPQDQPRIAFLVRHASDTPTTMRGFANNASYSSSSYSHDKAAAAIPATASTSSSTYAAGMMNASFGAGGRAVSSVWNTLTLRPSFGSGAAVGGDLGGAGDGEVGGDANVAKGNARAALAGGIGVDARKYIEGLLSLNR